MTELRKAAEMALEALELSHPRFGLATEKYKQAIKALCQALAQPEQEPAAWDGACVLGHCTSPAGCEDSNCCRANYNAPVDAVPGFTATEPRQSLSRMKPGDRFVLVRTSEIYHIKKDGSQWNDTRQRPARLHKNSQVRLIVTHPKCDDACMNICTEGFTKPPTCNTPVDAVNMSQECVDETAKVKYMDMSRFNAEMPNWKPGMVFSKPKREWVGLTDADIAKAMHGSVEGSNMLPYQFARAIEQALKGKNA